MRSLTITLVLFFSVLTCLSQDKVIISDDPPPPAARYPMFREVGSSKVFYNQSKDQTIARSKSFRVFGQDMEGLSLSAEFVSKGKKVSEPTNVTLKIFYIGKDRVFVDDRTLKIVIDNRELINGTSTFIRANESNVILATLEKEISLSDFTKISSSKIGRAHV